jgi:hypothetical protein
MIEPFARLPAHGRRTEAKLQRLDHVGQPIEAAQFDHIR